MDLLRTSLSIDFQKLLELERCLQNEALAGRTDAVLRQVRSKSEASSVPASHAPRLSPLLLHWRANEPRDASVSGVAIIEIGLSYGRKR